MALSVVPLLLHSDALPEGARLALVDALAQPETERAPFLANAARILYREASLECVDALELVGLAPPLDGSCGCG
ncbi:MAG TPA: hypothetical protein VH143_17570 [Kofleriaceae bacterium]|jgi:hypothetical protein|nr:hypothetical protein [Kofleriaceae bacterium]